MLIRTIHSVLMLGLVMLFSLLIPTNLPAEDNTSNTGIVYGKGHAFALTAPPGWVLDNKSGVNQGLFAVFYPKGSSWKDSPDVIYVNTSTKHEGETLESVMQSDVADHRDNYKTRKIVDAQPLVLANGRQVPVKYFLGDIKGNYEAVAYVEEQYITAFLVLTVREESLFRKDLPFFAKLVASYQFLTDKVKESSIPPIDYAVPPDIFQLARKELKTPEGDSYDQKFGEALGPYMADYMKECASGKGDQGWHRMVLAISKDGTLTHLYADGHDSVNDCLAPKLQKAKCPPPPAESFYYLFELKVDK